MWDPEPVSRSFIEDDDGIDDDNTEVEIHQWIFKDGANKPEQIDTLLVIDNDLSVQYAKQCIIHNLVPYCVYGKDIEMYKIPGTDIHVCVASKYKDMYAGVITEHLKPWLEIARRAISITLMHFVFYINIDNVEEQPCVIRALHTDDTADAEVLNIPILDTPNFVKGLSAGVLTLRQHLKLTASLYCCYLDSKVMDSLNTSAVTKLFKDLNIPCKPYTTTYTADNNLFM
uniref:Proteasome assembly chaperone 1 n=1 Tax=Xenopsylla cheopis TaxID=163159 RepID=A0A6M2DJ72_XENCH